MTQDVHFNSAVVEWARRDPTIEAVVLIGSQARHLTDTIWAADDQSDWDYQIVTTNPDRFLASSWTLELGNLDLRAYSIRHARLGDVPKISTVFAHVEADFVILPSSRLSQLRDATGQGKHHNDERIKSDLQKLAIVIRPGWRFLKGADSWEPFYRTIVTEVGDPVLTNDDIRNLAEAFVCDYVWARRKLHRGELVAVQRMIHRELVETNIRLLHELKLRQGERSFPEARRLELISTSSELQLIQISAQLTKVNLEAALKHCADTLSALTQRLVGTAWLWPIA